MPKIVLFNGPPRSGKDTAAKMAMQYLNGNGVFYRFAGPLKDAAHALFGMSGIDQEHFDQVKDVPCASFFGMTPREAYIWLSEKAVKPHFGNDFFTRVAINVIKQFDDRIIVISDCGFAEEVAGLIKEFGSDNVAIVYLKRQGTSFANDSRSYVTNADCKQFTIENDGGYGKLREKVEKILKGFIDAK